MGVGEDVNIHMLTGGGLKIHQIYADVILEHNVLVMFKKRSFETVDNFQNTVTVASSLSPVLKIHLNKYSTPLKPFLSTGTISQHAKTLASHKKISWYVRLPGRHNRFEGI